MFTLRYGNRMLLSVLRLCSKMSWSILLVGWIFHLITSWGLMWLSGEGDSLARFENFWWFHEITSSSTGYGDMSPTTFWGRFVTLYYIIPGGFIFFGAIIGKVSTSVMTIQDAHKKGLVQMRVTEHVLVLCDGTKKTAEIIQNLKGDSSCQDIVLVSPSAENSFGDDVHFVSGDATDEAVLSRACIGEASKVIVLGKDDAQTMGRCLAILSLVNDDCDIVAFFVKQKLAEDMCKLQPRIRCVLSMDMAVVVQETQDIGAASLLHTMLDNRKPGTYFRVVVPEHVSGTAEEISSVLLSQRVNLIGYYHGQDAPELMLDPRTPIEGGMALAVLAENRGVLNTLSWRP